MDISLVLKKWQALGEGERPDWSTDADCRYSVCNFRTGYINSGHTYLIGSVLRSIPCNVGERDAGQAKTEIAGQRMRPCTSVITKPTLIEGIGTARNNAA